MKKIEQVNNFYEEQKLRGETCTYGSVCDLFAVTVTDLKTFRANRNRRKRSGVRLVNKSITR